MDLDCTSPWKVDGQALPMRKHINDGTKSLYTTTIHSLVYIECLRSVYSNYTWVNECIALKRATLEMRKILKNSPDSKFHTIHHVLPTERYSQLY